jgi:hypothetical protein
MNCQYCNKFNKNSNAKKQHEIRCKLNPNRIIVKPSFGMLGKKGGNQWTKAKETGIPYILKEETRKKIIDKNKKRVWTIEQRIKHSISMKNAVKNNPDSYTAGNRGRTKQIEYEGIKFHGKWELDFYLWCLSKNINVKRCNEYFEYEWNGKRKYFPDFYLNDYDLYIEVKGYETDRDKAKWSQFPKKIKVIRKKEIFEIRKGIFVGL